MKAWLRILLVCCLFLMCSVITADARHKKEEEGLAKTSTADAALVDLKCVKCQNPMELGFLLEDQGYTANQTDTKWVQGPVIKKHFPFTDIETKVQRRVQAYRCTNCGYLEMYAR